MLDDEVMIAAVTGIVRVALNRPLMLTLRRIVSILHIVVLFKGPLSSKGDLSPIYGTNHLLIVELVKTCRSQSSEEDVLRHHRLHVTV